MKRKPAKELKPSVGQDGKVREQVHENSVRTSVRKKTENDADVVVTAADFSNGVVERRRDVRNDPRESVALLGCSWGSGTARF